MHSNSETFFRLHSSPDGECHNIQPSTSPSGTSLYRLCGPPKPHYWKNVRQEALPLTSLSPINIEGDLLMVDQIKGRSKKVDPTTVQPIHLEILRLIRLGAHLASLPQSCSNHSK
uniref:Uncharacterized protein n=1 Tax=Ditylenchus dipsaci TaxID=166011 RepID=A0A915D760_9BILA